MVDIVESAMNQSHPDRVAIADGGRVTTYGDLRDLTRRVSNGLARHIGTDDDRCLVVSHSGLEDSLALTLAGWSLGLRVAVLPPYLKAPEAARALQSCGPVLRVSESPVDSADVAYSDVVDGLSAALRNESDRAWLVTFTSGTTGVPKCVERQLSRLSADVEALATALDFGSSDRVTAITTALSTTSVLPALVAGAAVVKVPLESPTGFWKQVSELGITVISGTPYAYELAARRAPQRSGVPAVRTALNTSARLRPSTASRFMTQTGIPVRNIFCSSEAGHIAFNASEDPDRLATSVGRTLPGVEVEIRDQAGSLVQDGREGFICIRSPYSSVHYRNDPVGSAKVFADDWVLSSDIGYVDDGFIVLTGREDDRIHFGAAILDPQEIEDVLLRHGNVQDAIVVGDSHDRLGQIPVAKVVVNSEGVSKEDLMDHCRAELSASRCPQRIQFVASVDRDFKGQPIRPRSVRFSDV
jgi:acyl-coenzyme A synthetase/AMP-(fatty) acid ligase